jgi:uncharacterized protein
MTWRLAEIYRHPVKSLGEEALGEVRLEAGRPLPHDRAWAIAHGGAAWDPERSGWLPCGNFVTQRHVTALARTRIAWDGDRQLLSLSHPDRPDLLVDPDAPEGAEALTAWIAPLAGARQPGPYRLARLADGAFTDGEHCHVSIASTSSRRALAEIADQPLEPIRFRMNLWLDGLAAWDELDLVGREIAIGGARLRIVSRCERCRATTANPATGESDVPVPTLLRRHLGHMDFGVNAQVVAGGGVRTGDAARLV